MISRTQFIRVAARALARSQGQPLEMQAAVIADDIENAMQIAAELAGGNLTSPPIAEPKGAGPSVWPSVNPAALSKEPEQLVKLATSIPQNLGAPAVPRSGDLLRPQTAAPPVDQPKYSVEQLNLLIQERTPSELWVEVEDPGNPPRKVRLLRNVVSAHVDECVKLMYFHPSAKDDLVATAVIHITEVPPDLPAIMAKLARDGAAMCRPFDGPVNSVPPPVAQGPVVHASAQVAAGDVTRLQTIFQGSGS